MTDTPSKEEMFISMEEIMATLGKVSSTDIDLVSGVERVGVWRGDHSLESNIQQLKEKSGVLSNSCTKLAMINVESMPAVGLKSLFDELLAGSQAIIHCCRLLILLPMSQPMVDCVHGSVRIMLRDVGGLIHSIGSGEFEQCRSAVGLVWDANELIQKLPVSNKAAYRRSVMEVMNVVKDTHREFQEALATVGPQYCEATEDRDDGEVTRGDDGDDMLDDDLDMDDENYTVEDIPYVEACLVLMKASFNMLRLVTEVMACVCENAPPAIPPVGTGTEQSERHSDADGQYLDNLFVAEIYRMSMGLKKTMIDLGMEMYAPINLSSLKSQFEVSKMDLVSILQKVESYSPVSERAGEGLTKMRSIVQNVELQGVCFATLAS